MQDLPILEFASAAAFELWLSINHKTSKGICLKIYKRKSCIKSLGYTEAVEVALCYGWIDSQGMSYDDKAYLQRFTRRNPNSVWSKVNVARVEKLIALGRMHEAGMAVVEKAKANGSWQNAYDGQSRMNIPDDFMIQLRKNKPALAFFGTLNKTNLYAIAFRLQTAKKPETREHRMQKIIKMLSEGRKFY